MPSPDQRYSSVNDGSLSEPPVVDTPKTTDPSPNVPALSEMVSEEWRGVATDLINEELRCGRNLSAVQLAEENLTLILKHYIQSPLDVAGAYRMLAETYEAMKTPTIAIENWKSAALILRMDGGAQQLFRAEVCGRLACCYIEANNLEVAERWFRDSRRAFAGLTDIDTPGLRRSAESLLDVGKAFHLCGHTTRAITILRQAATQSRDCDGAGSSLHQDAVFALASAYLSAGKLDTAERLYQAALQNALDRESPPGAHHFFAHAGIAQVAFQRTPADYDRGLNFARYALQSFDPSEESQLAVGAYMEFMVGRQFSRSEDAAEFREALPHFERALRLARRCPDSSSAFLSMIQEPFADYLASRGALQREEAIRVELIESLSEVFGAESAEVLKSRRDMLLLYQRKGDPAAALVETEKIANIVHKLKGGVSSEYVEALRDWAAASLYAKDPAMAESLLSTARRIVGKLPDAKLLRIELLDDMASQAAYLDDVDRAVRMRHAATLTARRYFGDEHDITAESKRNEARLLAEVGRNEEALVLAGQALSHFETSDQPFERGLSWATVAYVRSNGHDFEQADADFLRAINILDEARLQEAPDYAVVVQDYALMRGERAMFYQNRDFMEEAYGDLRNAIGITRRAKLYERVDTLDLLAMGIELTEGLDMSRQADLYRKRYDNLKKRLA